MKRNQSFALVVALLLPLLPGCAAQLETVDGYDAEYVGTPPVGVEGYPSYEIDDGYVYNVNGAYYHRHGDRWVRYRSPPPPRRR